MNGEFRSFYSDKKVDRTNRSAAKGREHALDVRLDDNISQNPEIAKLGSQQTDAALANTSREYRNASEFYRNIIAKVLNYKFSDEKIRKMQALRTKTAPPPLRTELWRASGRKRTSRTGTVRSLLSLAISENRPCPAHFRIIWRLL